LILIGGRNSVFCFIAYDGNGTHSCYWANYGYWSEKKWKPLFDKPTELEKLFVFSPKILRDFFGEKILYYYYIIFGILFMLGSICFFVYLVFIF